MTKSAHYTHNPDAPDCLCKGDLSPAMEYAREELRRDLPRDVELRGRSARDVICSEQHRPVQSGFFKPAGISALLSTRILASGRTGSPCWQYNVTFVPLT